MGDWQSRIFDLILYLPAFIIALTVHEFAHAWAGHRLGDDTARREGRLTLDPAAHLDPLGSILIVIAILSGLPLIGWAKPVPFNPRNLQKPRRDSVLIALAGPASNFLQIPIWLGLLALLSFIGSRLQPNGEFIFALLQALEGKPDTSNILSVFGAVLATGVIVNLGLAFFNLIPLPPLDGHYVLEAYGPPSVATFYDAIRPWSFLVLYVLLVSNVIDKILNPVYGIAFRLIGLALRIPLG